MGWYEAKAAFINFFCMKEADEKCSPIAINIRAIFQKCVSATYPVPFDQIKKKRRKSDSLFSNNNSEGQSAGVLLCIPSAFGKSILLPFRFTSKLHQHPHTLLPCRQRDGGLTHFQKSLPFGMLWYERMLGRYIALPYKLKTHGAGQNVINKAFQQIIFSLQKWYIMKFVDCQAYHLSFLLAIIKYMKILLSFLEIMWRVRMFFDMVTLNLYINAKIVTRDNCILLNICWDS